MGKFDEYTFILMVIDPNTGIYNNIGVTTEESTVAKFLTEIQKLCKVEIFHNDELLDGPIRIITSIEEFEELQ